MAKDNVIDLKKPESFTDDPITDILRQGARLLLATALETEINIFLNQYKEITDAKGNQRVVRNGHLPEREVQTGIGQVPVKMPRIRDQQPDSPNGGIKFTSAILPPYLRRTQSIETLLPWLYLKGVSTGDFAEALTALLENPRGQVFILHTLPKPVSNENTPPNPSGLVHWLFRQRLSRFNPGR